MIELNLKSPHTKSRRRCIGIDIGSHSIKVIGFEEENKRLAIRYYGHTPTIENITNEEGLIQRLDHIRSELGIQRGTDTAIAINGSDCLTIKTEFAITCSENELREKMPDLIKEYIPIEMRDCVYDYTVLEKTPTGYVILLSVVPLAVRDFYSKVVNTAGFRLAVIDVGPIALLNAVLMSENTKGVCAYVNAGANTTYIHILNNGVTTFMRNLSLGGNLANQNIKQEVASAMNPVGTPEDLKIGLSGKNSNIALDVDASVKRAYDTIATEIKKSLDFFEATILNVEVEDIHLSGGVANDDRFREALEMATELKVHAWNPLAGFGWIAPFRTTEELYQVQSEARSMAIAVGCALRYNY